MNNKNGKDTPLVEMSKEEREKIWDELFVKEEGVVLEFDHASKVGRIRSLHDDCIYKIDSREPVKQELRLKPGDKVLFAPIEDPGGDDYAKIIYVVGSKI